MPVSPIRVTCHISNTDGIFFLWEQHAQCGLDLRHVTVIELVGTYPAQIGRIRHTLLPPGLALQLRYSQQHTFTHTLSHCVFSSDPY